MRTPAAVAIACTAAALAGCDDPDGAGRGVDARSLAGAGLSAVAAEPARVRVAAHRHGALLRVRVSGLERAGGLAVTAELFDSVRARIVPFCPPPGILRCKPALRATGTLGEGRSAESLVPALRRLARHTYQARVLVRRRGDAARIVTPHGELLGAVAARGRTVRLSFGGPGLQPAPVRGSEGRLVLEAGSAAIAVVRATLPGRERRVLDGVRRLSAAAPLPPRGPARSPRAD